MTPEQFVNMVLNAPNPQDSVRAVMLLRKQAAQDPAQNGRNRDDVSMSQALETKAGERRHS